MTVLVITTTCAHTQYKYGEARAGPLWSDSARHHEPVTITIKYWLAGMVRLISADRFQSTLGDFVWEGYCLKYSGHSFVTAICGNTRDLD